MRLDHRFVSAFVTKHAAKADPEAYVKATSALGLKPDICFVIKEDGEVPSMLLALLGWIAATHAKRNSWRQEGKYGPRRCLLEEMSNVDLWELPGVCDLLHKMLRIKLSGLKRVGLERDNDQIMSRSGGGGRDRGGKGGLFGIAAARALCRAEAQNLRHVLARIASKGGVEKRATKRRRGRAE